MPINQRTASQRVHAYTRCRESCKHASVALEPRAPSEAASTGSPPRRMATTVPGASMRSQPTNSDAPSSAASAPSRPAAVRSTVRAAALARAFCASISSAKPAASTCGVRARIRRRDAATNDRVGQGEGYSKPGPRRARA